MIDGRATDLEIRIWHMNAALNRARSAVEHAGKLRHPDYWYQKYGNYAIPPARHYIEAWDRLYAWKQEWLAYGEALKAGLEIYRGGNPPQPKERANG
jgi:hypothetical protein